MKLRSAIVFLLVSSAFGSSVPGDQVTWEFAGEVTSVGDPLNILQGMVTVGSPLYGSYTFDSTTPDSAPDVPSSGFYVDAITAVSGQLGDVSFLGPVGPGNSILILDDFPTSAFDNYSISAGSNTSAVCNVGIG